MSPEMIARHCVAMLMHLEKLDQYKNLSLDEKFIALQSCSLMVQQSMASGIQVQIMKQMMENLTKPKT